MADDAAGATAAAEPDATEDMKIDTAPEEDQSDSAAMSSRSTRKRGRSASPTTASKSTSADAIADATAAAAQAAAVSAASAAAGAQAAQLCGLTGLYTLLTTTSGGAPTATTTMPSMDQVRQAATRAVNDAPPYVHLSNRDSATQLKIEDGPVGRRLTLRGGMRGYRMSRATHGVTEGTYYYEVLVLPSPTARELVAKLPPNVRLGPKFQKQLQEQLLREEQQKTLSKTDEASEGGSKSKSKKRKLEEQEPPPPSVGGHVRIGWSMRTGDLQAPVGYDKWSYGLRDIMGSRCHNSKREDRWGGEPFGPGDVVGFAISLTGPDRNKEEATNTKKGTTWSNHIRFFRNGEAMGHFVISKGKREGGAAFDDIQDGTYYPAISAYMGGSVRVNFGPHFVYPPRMLPSGMKVSPVSDLCPTPQAPQDVVDKAMKERAFSKKTDEAHVNAFRDAVMTEAQIRYDAYTNHLNRHVEEVGAARQERGMSDGDLPEAANKGSEAMDVEKTEAT